MNKILLGLNIVLLLAVGFLYYSYFRYIKNDAHIQEIANKRSADSFKIAYFDIDTLENYYDYSKEVRGYLMKKDSGNQVQLARMRANINNEIKQYNQAGAAYTQLQQSSFQQKMQDLQAEYENTGNELQQQLQSESFQKLHQVQVKIQQFLKQYCQDKGYAYVFATKEYDNMLYYKDTIRNVTTDVVNGLNLEYRNGQNK